MCAKVMDVKVSKKPQMNERIKRIWEKMQKIDRERKRVVFAVSSDIAMGQAACGPPSGSRKGLVGSFSAGRPLGKKFVLLGDQTARVRVDYPFPGKLPSSRKGFSYDSLNWAEDFAAYLDQSPAEVCPDQFIVGEFHWSFAELRKRVFPDPEQLEILAEKAAKLGSGGFPATHTCADLSIGLTQGWNGILERIKENRRKFSSKKEEKEAEYLHSAEMVCLALMRFIKKHSQKALSLAEKETDETKRETYLRIAKVCQNISRNPPTSFYEAVQWIWFYIMVERMELGGNGYGRLDQLLYPFYEKDIKEGRITRIETRELIAELFLKYPTYYSLGGRNIDGKDATNEVSWLALEAYDMVGGRNAFGVLWHSDIDKDFFRYACDILARHGTGSPTLVNQDIMRESEIKYGVKKEDSWNVAYSGCFWYCIPGKERCSHDMQAVSGIKCFMNALDVAFQRKINSLKQLWQLFCLELDKAVRAMKELTDWQFERIPDVYPEIVTSLMTHDCIENGRDITDCGTPYNTTVVQFQGIANIADSLIAVKHLVFDQERISFDELEKALAANFEGYETIRQLLLHSPKFGNDDDRVDEMAEKVAQVYRDTLAKYRNGKGFAYRPAFFSWAGHAYAGEMIGATPDGRKKSEPIAQGPNPVHGRNTKGITATANSVRKLDFKKNAGGTLQLELDSSLLELEDPARLIENIVVPYFKMDGVHVSINVVSAETLKKAIEHPEKYEHLVIRVTGFSVHFVQIDRKIQEEIIARTRHRMG